MWRIGRYSSIFARKHTFFQLFYVKQKRTHSDMVQKIRYWRLYLLPIVKFNSARCMLGLGNMVILRTKNFTLYKLARKWIDLLRKYIINFIKLISYHNLRFYANFLQFWVNLRTRIIIFDICRTRNYFYCFVTFKLP